MSQEIQTLAQTLVTLIRDPQYSPDVAAARVTVMLEQVCKAAVLDISEPMETMAKAGCIVTLGVGPYGWHCRVMDPDFEGRNKTGEEAAIAVDRAFTDWKAHRGISEEPQEQELTHGV